ncbi:DSBA-like thioredoxin domain protein [Plesiocystis pacifica SIR-1]|uniref:DSBA-like thioredoxin domain protein n=1 Tax=Plesiocystis pacifica SIR-1 TaxID=391625 RepID=A6GEL0_9BACT|nr:thioredoxin domain-containing protein [Plesiocystis pacifica]EDM75718.1 DSBA-like thioredoxin domain protein [Plesiocystis pacifica SIR-1]
MSDYDDTKTRDDETLDESQTNAEIAEALRLSRAKKAGAGGASVTTESTEAAAPSGVGEDAPQEPDPAQEVEAAEQAAKDANRKDVVKSAFLGNLVFVLGFVATLIAGYYVGQWARLKFGDKPQPDGGDRYRVELRGDEPQKGPDDALVTIIEFADFQCPYCEQSVEPLAAAMDSYEGDVRLIFKHYPLPGHRLAAPAAYTSWAAHQQGEFWIFHDRLFAAKSAIDDTPDWIKELGLDAEKFGRDMESLDARSAVDEDMAAGGKVGVTGTPAFLVNGHMYRGKRDELGWKKIIAAELDYAEEIKKSEGLARGEVYDFLMKDALDKQVGAPERKAAPKKRRPGEPDDVSVYAVPITGAPAKGPADALVTVVEFADYHCPYCVRVKTAVDKLAETYPNDVRVVYRQRPLAMHPNARDASRAALAAHQQGKFWEMHDKLFLHQAQTLDEFEKLAAELGLDVEKFVTDYDGEAVAAALQSDLEVAQRFGISGTPAFFVNGRYLSGAQSFAVFEQVFEERRAEAKGLVDAGTPASGVYAKIIADGKPTAKD